MRCLVLIAGLVGCSSGSPDGSGPPVSAADERLDHEGAEAAVPAAAPATPTPVRVHYDLARALDAAELFEGPVRAMDHGTPAGAKYTLGGWLSRVDRHRDLDGTSAAIVRGTVGRLALPWDGSGPASLALRARGFGAPNARVYVNGEQVGTLELSESSFVTGRFEVPESALRAGENTLLLRTTRSGNAPGLRDAGLAIDWVRIGPAGAELADGTPSATPVEIGGHPALRIGRGIRLGWALEVPADARLRLVLRSGAVRVEAQRDGTPGRILDGADAADGPVRLDLDLGMLAGDVTRIDLVATSDAEVVRPAIVVPRAEAEAAPPARNAVIYLIDTLRADKLAPYNPDTRVRTPGLVQFVREALTFSQARSQENWTKPSVATLLSSLMPWEHTAVDDASRVPASVELLPELLGDRGFHTGAFIANGYVSDRFGFGQGWDTYRNYIREERRTDAEHVAADVLQWLDDRPQDEPFFLYIHTIDPHVPYRPPDEFLRMYEEEPYRGRLSFRRNATLLEDVKSGRIRTDARDRAHLEALYDGEISYHDVHFTAIVDGLRRRGLLDDTVVVITADHGEEFWDHGSVGHGHNVYDELLHVPLFVRMPGARSAPRRVDAPVGLVDVMPTVLEALGEEIPDDLSGRSLVPLLSGADETVPPVAVSGFMNNWRTLALGRYKLVHRTAEGIALYDLEEDPGEQTDVAGDHPITVRLARGRLGPELARTSDRVAPSPTRRRHRPEETTIDAETEAQLRALGYIVD